MGKSKHRDPLMVDRIKSAVNAVLASKGGQKCHPARALLSSQSKQRTISNRWAPSTMVSGMVGAGGGSAALATPLRPLKPTRSVHSWSISSTLIRRR